MYNGLEEKDIGFRLYEKEIFDACVIKVKAGTTGFKGGDAGHGGRTFIKIEDIGGADIHFKATQNEMEKSLIMTLYGDAELNVMIEGLEWITKKLKENKGER